MGFRVATLECSGSGASGAQGLGAWALSVKAEALEACLGFETLEFTSGFRALGFQP